MGVSREKFSIVIEPNGKSNMANARRDNERREIFVPRGSWIFILPILASFDLVVSGEREICPNFCDCFFLYGLKWADCSGHRLYSVQTGVNEAVQALDLSNNSISSLANYELREAHLTKLKLLNLSSNSISDIGLNAFVDLSELRVLDLSKNHLYQILPNTFVANKKLEVLDLSSNNLNHHVPRLRSSSITSLDLAKCGISFLPPSTFDGLPRLRALDIADNMMIQFDLETLNRMSNLRILMFERNPWICNGQLYELQNRLRGRKIIFKRVCDSSKLSSDLPKKSEKMIISEGPKTMRKYLYGDGKRWDSSKIVNSSKIRQISTISHDDSNFSFLSPYWFVAIGFLLGSAISTVLTYLWLSRSLSMIQLANHPTSESTRSRSIDGDNNQRANLLQHVWQNNHDETISSRSDCPGTPPPPYRDVILNSSNYPRANVY